MDLKKTVIWTPKFGHVARDFDWSFTSLEIILIAFCMILRYSCMLHCMSMYGHIM